MAHSLSDSCIEDGMAFDRPTTFAFERRLGARKVAWDAFVARAREYGIDPIAARRGYDDVPVEAPAARYDECLAGMQAAIQARNARVHAIATAPRTPWARRLSSAVDSDAAPEGSMELQG